MAQRINQKRTVYLIIAFGGTTMAAISLMASILCSTNALQCSEGKGWILFATSIAIYLVGGSGIEMIFILLNYLSGSSNSSSLLGTQRLEESHVPIIYSKYYNITAFGLEKMHPFDSTKYMHVLDTLIANNLITEDQLIEPDPVEMKDLIRIHSVPYLLSLHFSIVLTKILEVPLCFLPSPIIYWRVLMPMLYQMGGSLLAAKLALSHGWAINLGGGFHHAYRTNGSGFCVYADISMAIKCIRQHHPGELRKAMIVDLDAHQGNGHERDFLDDNSVFIFDAYNPTIFPCDAVAARGIDTAILTTAQMSDSVYLSTLTRKLSQSILEFCPNFIVYNAGTDCLQNDPLGQLTFSRAALIARDEIVFRLALKASPPIPIMMVLSGGYQKNNAELIASSIENLNAKFNLV